MRRLYLNLKDKSNKQLRESVVDGGLAVDRLCSMSVQVRFAPKSPMTRAGDSISHPLCSTGNGLGGT
jgi:hypothetical protein